MIKLLESEKHLIEYMLNLSSEDKVGIIKEWGLAAILMLSSLKSIVTQGDQSLIDSDLEALLVDLDSTITELKAGMGYTGPIGQA
jgi:hypothetical protein